jgi:hypothetical protein
MLSPIQRPNTPDFDDREETSSESDGVCECHTNPLLMNLIDEFYRRLRAEGVFCAKDWECCMNCGHCRMEDMGHRNYVFYHQQDGDRLRDGDEECHFAFYFADDAIRQKVKTLVAELGGEWSGCDKVRILLRV